MASRKKMAASPTPGSQKISHEELVKEVSVQVKTVVQTPEVIRLLVDGIIDSVTKIVVERLEKLVQFNSEAVHQLETKLKERQEEVNDLKEEVFI